MAAAEFFAEAEVDRYGKTQFTGLTQEEDLEAQAKDVEARMCLLQANIRGFLGRQKHVSSTDMRHNIKNKHVENATSPRTEEIVWKTKHHSVQTLPCLEIVDKTDPSKDFQIAKHWNIESGFISATGSLDLGIGTTIPDLMTLMTEELELESKLEQAANAWTRPSHVSTASWWIEIPLELESRDLCTICSHINFAILLHTTQVFMDDTSIPLGGLQNILRKTECAFCRLLTHLASILLESSIESLKDNAVANAVDCHICADPDWGRCVTRIRQICLKLTVPLPGGTRYHVFGRIQQILQNNEHPSEQKFNDVRLEKEFNRFGPYNVLDTSLRRGA